MSTPGHSTSGADGVGDGGWVTPGVALEKKLAHRLLSEGELSGELTLEANEQPDRSTALASSGAARRRPRFPSSSPQGIEFTRFFRQTSRVGSLLSAKPWQSKGAVRIKVAGRP